MTNFNTWFITCPALIFAFFLIGKIGTKKFVRNGRNVYRMPSKLMVVLLAVICSAAFAVQLFFESGAGIVAFFERSTTNGTSPAWAVIMLFVVPPVIAVVYGCLLVAIEQKSATAKKLRLKRSR